MSYSKIVSFVSMLYALALSLINELREKVTRFRTWHGHQPPPVKLMKVTARGVYGFITPVLRPAGLAMAFTVMAFTGLYAQTDGLDTTTAETLINSAPYIFGILVTVGGYLSPYIPLLNQIESGTYRVLALAIVMIIGFVLFGFSDVLPLVLAYASSTSIYEVFLKLIFKTSKPSET